LRVAASPAPVADEPVRSGGPAEPTDLLFIDDLLESVDFDEPARAYPARGRLGGRGARGDAPTDSVGSRIKRPLSAWPMGAG